MAQESEGRPGVHSRRFVHAHMDSALTGHQLLGPEDSGMTTCPSAETRPVWETNFNPIVPKPCAMTHRLRGSREGLSCPP